MKSKKYEVLLQARLAKAPLNVECGKGRNKSEPLFVKIIHVTKPKFKNFKKDLGCNNEIGRPRYTLSSLDYFLYLEL